MHRIEDKKPAGSVVMLPAILDLTAADALLVELRSRLMEGAPCRIDASQVENLMLPGLQVILAAVRSSKSIEVVNPSAAFCSAFEDAALSWKRAEDHGRLEQPQPASEAGYARPGAATDGAPLAPSAAKRILTIDDSRTMRDMLRLTLSGAGYDVLQAVDGQDGLDLLRKERVDVVITDINMPKLDGYGVIRHLRADSEYDDTPILVLSTESDQTTKEIGRDAGATGWLVKPFDPDQLIDIVRQVSP
jgi:two-component system chemotaxis response regulator CheY